MSHNTVRDTPSPLRLLLVHSSEMFRSLAAQVLSHDPRVVVVSVETKQDARDQIKQHSLDLICIDLSLSDGSGLEFVRDLKARNGTERLYVMIPYDLPQYRTVAEAVGADGVICKADFKDECTRLLDGMDRLNA